MNSLIKVKHYPSSIFEEFFYQTDKARKGQQHDDSMDFKIIDFIMNANAAQRQHIIETFNRVSKIQKNFLLSDMDKVTPRYVGKNIDNRLFTVTYKPPDVIKNKSVNSWEELKNELIIILKYNTIERMKKSGRWQNNINPYIFKFFDALKTGDKTQIENSMIYKAKNGTVQNILYDAIGKKTAITLFNNKYNPMNEITNNQTKILKIIKSYEKGEKTR